MREMSPIIHSALASKGLLANVVGVASSVVLSMSEQVASVVVAVGALAVREMSGYVIRALRKKYGIKETGFLSIRKKRARRSARKNNPPAPEQ